MSKRKLPVSYSSLRRQIRAQVDADLHLIENGDGNESSDQSGDEVAADVAVGNSCFDSFCEHSPVSGESDAGDSPNAETGDIDFDDCHWVDSETDSDIDDEHAQGNKDDIISQVNEWANKYGLPHVAITELMHILRPHLTSLPCDSRTLLHTPRTCSVKQLKCGGEYCHLGLAKGLKEVLKNSPPHQTRCLEVQFNIDGVPLFKSSNSSLWPILCKVKVPNIMEPFLVGIYHGNEKPADASEFLSEFVAEMSDLATHGVTVADSLYSVKIHSFVCDAPARAFLKGVKCHSGYAACEKCTEYGEYLGKVIYRGTNAPPRTDIAFDEFQDEDHHTGPCPLKPLVVGCVSQFGLDYMHLVCLGVVRRLLLYWKGPVGPHCVRLGSRLVNELSQKLMSLCRHIPVEFARKPRSLIEVMRWKATEFRQFLLYTGPVVLCGILSENLYNHFMLLSIGIRILTTRQLALTFCDYANELLMLFVSEAEKLYGKEIYVYNVHSLIHLANDVKNLGALDDFSSFPFENKLGQLKKMIRKPQFPIQQIVYRLTEKQHVKSACCSLNVTENVIITMEHSAGPLLAAYRSYRQYQKVKTEKFTVSLSLGNNCILADNGYPALVRNILHNDEAVVLMCQHFAATEDAFVYPLPSSKLSIFKVCDKMTDVFALPLSSVVQKCVLLPMIDRPSSVVLPLLH